jgi:manganese transport system substrate-binding protein
MNKITVMLLSIIVLVSACGPTGQPTPNAANGTPRVAAPQLAELGAACPAGGAPNATPAADAKKVLTTFTVLADMANNVACGLLDVQSVTRVGAEIHGYEPTPGDVARAQDADLLLENGLNLERWFERFLGAVGDVPSVTLTDGIEPIGIAEGPYQDMPNPHAWMSPRNALIYVENIRKAFVALDPANEAAYTANAAAYSAQINAISTFLETSIAQVPEAQRILVSCEGAYSYLTRDYGLQELYMWPINADQNGTPQQVAAVIDGVRANNVPVVFCESTVNTDAMETVAEQTGAAFGGVLYVDSLTLADGPAATYLELLHYDVTTIVNGLVGISE